MIAPGAVTDWIPMVSRGAGNGSGWWQLPDIGTQVLLGFVGASIKRPVVLGCIYDLKHKPPGHSTEKAADSVVWQTKNHRLEIIDEEGKEEVILSTAKGKMRYRMTSGKGIEIINELGDIRIKCRKLTIAGEDKVQIQAKKVSMAGEEDVTIKAKKNIKLECDKEVKLKGKNIKLEASKGITTGGKQLAAEGDKVMGFDIHQMVVPAGTGTAVVPLPHPYLGKLADKLSKDVKINGHNAATKGSKSKHDNPVHNQLPGTIQFRKNPSKEGEVTGGTAPKVKINGKEAAVIGSMVTTCNDTGARNNSTIIAPGASIPMPVIINPDNMGEYERERAEQETKHPEFTTVKWGKGKVREGEETELLAQVKDIGDGNPVTFRIWKDGQDPAVNIAQGQIVKAVEGGAAKAVFSYRLPSGEHLPEADPKWYFTAHSAWCPWKKSGMITVELLRPEITKCEWQKDGKSISEALVGDEVTLHIETKDIEDGDTVRVEVWEHDEDNKHDYVTGLTGTVGNGKAEVRWQVVYREDNDDSTSGKELAEKGYTLPEYHFTVRHRRSGSAESPVVHVKGWTGNILKEKETKDNLANKKYTLFLPDNMEIEGQAGEDGVIDERELPVGNYYIVIQEED
jgi:phage baseplate assembly protein gpV